jgi:hypothetical protein
MTGHEQQLLTRAEMLEDTGDLVQLIAGVLAGAQGAGVDPAAVTSLAAAARALDPGAGTSYDAGSKQDRRPGGGYRSDSEMLEAISEVEDDLQERLREVAAAPGPGARDAGRRAGGPRRGAGSACRGPDHAGQGEMRWMPRCPGRRVCEAAAELLDLLAARLQRALERLRAAPQDLGEVYELVYNFIRKGGKLPVYARWIEGEGALR